MPKRRYDIIAIILIVLYLSSYISHAGLTYLQSRFFMPGQIAAMTTQLHLMSTLRALLDGLVSFGVAIWLYRKAGNTGRSKLVWLLMGLAFSVLGAVFFLMIEWYYQKRHLGYCSSCGYDLRESPSGICPECGGANPPPPQVAKS